MQEAERAGIHTQIGDALQECGRGRAHQQRRQQSVFLRARDIDFVDIAGYLVLSEKIGAQSGTRNACLTLDRGYTFRRHARPIGDRRLGNAQTTSELSDATYGTEGFGETGVAHSVSLFFTPEFLARFRNDNLLPSGVQSAIQIP
jgi:hypothetical protein